MKKLLSVLLLLGLMFCLFSCGGSSGDLNDKDVVNGEGKDANETSDNTQIADDVTIEETVLMDRDNIKVTATELNTDALMGAEISVQLENNSAQNITVQVRNCTVNDLMIDPLFSAEVAAGKKANDTITFMSSDLKTSEITVIQAVEFSIHVFDSDTFETICDTERITLTTTADPSYTQVFDDSGFTAVDEDGIKIVVKKMNSSDSFWGADIYLYLENNTDKNITVQAKDVSINGYMVDPFFSCDIVAGKKAVDTITFMQSDLDDNNITDIQDLETKFHIFDTDTWDGIKDTDAITITFE